MNIPDIWLNYLSSIQYSHLPFITYIDEKNHKMTENLSEFLDNVLIMKDWLMKLITENVIIGISSLPSIFTPSLIMRDLSISNAVHYLLLSEDICPLLNFKKISTFTSKLGKTFHLYGVVCQIENSSYAYVISTSGSTGKPKIIHVPFDCIIPNITDFRQIFDFKIHDVILITAPFTFDPSIVDLFLAFATGCSMIIVHPSIRLLGDLMLNICFKEKVSFLQITTSLLNLWSKKPLHGSLLSSESSLRILAIGGEPLPRAEITLSWKAKNNQTRIFALYGITEVSCWATYYEITSNSKGLIPLGKPLSETCLEVKVDNSDLLVREGILYIGSATRVCHIDNEEIKLDFKTFRITGDIVLIKDGEYYFKGRQNEVNKRYGVKIYLGIISDTLASTSDKWKSISLLINNTLITFVQISNSDKNNMEKKILNTLKTCLPSSYIPDEIISINEFPLTSHGKIDKNVLRSMIQKKYSSENICCSDMNQFLTQQMKLYWISAVQKIPSTNDNFLADGGTSFQAWTIAEKLYEYCPFISLSKLMQKLLNSSFASVYFYLEYLENNNDFDESVQKSVVKKNSYDEVYKLDDKIHTEHYRNNIISLSRGKMFGNNKIIWFGHKNFFISIKLLDLKFKWLYHTQKCIDSSPCIIHLKHENLVVAASHSGEIVVVHLENGELKWCSNINERIEASPIFCHHNFSILIGTYSHRLYCLDIETGSILWWFQTEGIIKCTACVNPALPHAYFGSYDYYIYCINVINGSLIWKNKFCNSSIFSSSVLSVDSKSLYSASLGGSCCKMRTDNSLIYWIQSLKKPIFSSACLLPTSVAWGCVDGSIYLFSHEGLKLWVIQTDGPIFSSVISFSELHNPLLVVPSYDHYIYLLYADSGRIIWKTNVSGPCYSSPVFYENNIIVSNNDGAVFVIDLFTGCIKNKIQLPGKCFSSPALWNDTVVFGSRSNDIYALTLF